MPKRFVIAIVGPTATGKSELAQSLALKLDGEIVSADSMQIYEGLDIGTAKLAPNEQKVPHFGIDITTIDEAYSAALYQDYARGIIKDIWARNKQPIMCGGTGLYIRAALDEMDFPKGEYKENPLRKHYEKLLKEEGPEKLFDELLKLDPEAKDYLHQNNTKRVIRALEMASQGVLYSKSAQSFKERIGWADTLYIGLRLNREELYDRINKRVDQMLDKGLLEEVKALKAQGLEPESLAYQAIGYKELLEALDEDESLEDAVQLIKRNSRRYAKRQMTWFNSDNRITWIDVDGKTPDDVSSEALAIIEEWARDKNN